KRGACGRRRISRRSTPSDLIRGWTPVRRQGYALQCLHHRDRSRWTIPTALIFGISGQDGSLLAQHLLGEGWAVHGTSRNAALHDFRNLARLGIRDRVTLHSSDPAEFRSVMDVVARTAPAEIYNLSGQTSVGLSFDQPVETNNSIL